MNRAVMAPRVAVVGHGLLGAPLARALRSRGADVVTVALTSAYGVDLAADLTTGPGRRALVALLKEQRSTCVVLVHGPGNVTWIEDNEELGRAAHEGTARAVCGYPVLLVSTDNVFSGDDQACTVGSPVRPANAYGRVKLAAERAVLAVAGPSAVARLSMVYGWSAPGRRATYAHLCLDAARSGRSMRAPADQSFTPLYIGDATEVLAALALNSPSDRLWHFAGSVELSRYAFARLAYSIAGADPDLVVPTPRAQTEWACRPRRSVLVNSDPADLAPWLDWRPMGPSEGLEQMVRTDPMRSLPDPMS